MLSEEQRLELDRNGIVRLPGAVPRSDAEEMCDSIWTMLERSYQISRGNRETWKSRRVAGTHDVPRSVTFGQVGSPGVREALDDLFGPGEWQEPDVWGSLLVSFPDSDRWDVPSKSWHLDFPALRSAPGLFAVRIFTCLAGLEAGGGGTVFVAGSHRLVQNLFRIAGPERFRSADARRALIAKHVWMKELCSRDQTSDRVDRLMRNTTVVDGVDVRVVEMASEAGDVLLTHPLLLHAGARNCAIHPRMVLSTTVYRGGFDWRTLFAGGGERA